MGRCPISFFKHPHKLLIVGDSVSLHKIGNAFIRLQKLLVKMQQTNRGNIREKSLTRIFLKKPAEILRGNRNMPGSFCKSNGSAEIFADKLHTLFNALKVALGTVPVLDA